jgi:hypothetical protein
MKALHTLLSLAALASLSVATAQPQFNHDPSQLSATLAATNAVAIVDVDLDGFDDLVFANGSNDFTATGDPQHLFLNNAGNPPTPGKFSNASANLGGVTGNAHMVIAEDIDGDGDPDLIFAIIGTGGKPRILINQGGHQGGTTGEFQDDTANRFPLGLTLSSWCVVGGDVDDDGHTDLLFTDSTSAAPPNNKRVRLLMNDGFGSFSDVTLLKLPNESTDAHEVAIFDFDGDFDLDIALAMQAKAGSHFGRLYLNDGTGSFVGGVSNSANGLGTPGSWETDWADLDADGDWDASVTALFGSGEGWGRNDGAGPAMPEFQFSGTNGFNDREMAHFDYDVDGDLDVFVSQEWLSGSVDERVYQYAGGIFTYAPNLIEFKADKTRDMGIRDLNEDGFADLVTAQWGTGDLRNKIYLNNGVFGTDATPPVVLNLEQPLSVSPGDMVFQIHVQDGIVDDGKTNVTVDYTYCVSTGCPCALHERVSGEAFHQGGGMYRVRVPTDELSIGVEVTWTIRDDAGNETEAVVQVGDLPLGPWCDLGHAKLGVHGYPALSGTGPVTAGSMNSVDLTNANENTHCLLVYGFETLILPIKGGVLVPHPFDLIPLAIGASGSLSLPMQWPVGIPGGVALYMQYWISDDAATHDWSASNGLMAIGMDP